MVSKWQQVLKLHTVKSMHLTGVCVFIDNSYIHVTGCAYGVFRHDLQSLLYLCRGQTFRTVLDRIGEVRSILPDGLNIMALTATATRTLRYSRLVNTWIKLITSTHYTEVWISQQSRTERKRGLGASEKGKQREKVVSFCCSKMDIITET